jgi:hypothetical protein
MSQDAAKIVLETIIKHQAEQNACLIAIREKCTDEEFGEYRRMIGRSMGAMLLEVINPIITKYPDLTPTGLRDLK